MPAYLGKNRFFGAKIITAFPENPQKNLASHLGQILLFDSSTGRPVAMMDANAITWLRTAAVSALATDYLAAPKAKSIALIGAGQQASSHLAALQSVRAIEKVFIYDRTAERAGSGNYLYTNFQSGRIFRRKRRFAECPYQCDWHIHADFQRINKRPC